ncbi:ribosome maturation factor RimP [Desulfobotulus sp. H1]|uniref:Ribosome maturation factor RimP n=1 Tax=Desulfobotulus pelophilus TaxID=2823377 RepID=A0ABT3NE27_9BACT|nr:ribosome maturation factor RimP [Desulfobotulus pelophilus]MCW7755177.1 ribosome maturation factor RimP [Desulfobotulus pelophilus]
MIQRVHDLAQPLLESQGLELVLADLVLEDGRRILRIFLDKPGGITLDDCVRFAKEFGYLLDIHINIPGQYSLEVSSPGINRPLVKPWDFERFAGETVRVRTRIPIDGQRNFRGELLGITEGMVHIKLEEKTAAISFGEIHSARLCRD